MKRDHAASKIFGHELYEFGRIEDEDSCAFVKIRVIRDQRILLNIPGRTDTIYRVRTVAPPQVNEKMHHVRENETRLMRYVSLRNRLKSNHKDTEDTKMH